MIRRWITSLLFQQAAALLPESQRSWAGAMRSESAYMDEREGLAWARGCAWAGLKQRLRHPDVSPGRLALAGMLLILVTSDSFATALTAAYRMDATRWAEALGRMTPGDDYHRLIPLMDAIPVWVHAMWVTAAACYLIAIPWMLLKLRGAYAAVLAAMALELAAGQLAEPMIEATGVRANPHPSMLAIVLPLAVPLGLAAILWVADRPLTAKRT